MAGLELIATSLPELRAVVQCAHAEVLTRIVPGANNNGIPARGNARQTGIPRGTFSSNGGSNDETTVRFFASGVLTLGRQGGRGFGPGGRGDSARPRRRGQHDPPGPDRLRRPRQRGGRQRHASRPTGRSSWWPWPTCSRTGWTPRTRTSSESSATGSTSRRSGGSWASTPTARRSTACARATWPC